MGSKYIRNDRQAAGNQSSGSILQIHIAVNIQWPVQETRENEDVQIRELNSTTSC